MFKEAEAVYRFARCKNDNIYSHLATNLIANSVLKAMPLIQRAVAHFHLGSHAFCKLRESVSVLAVSC